MTTTTKSGAGVSRYLRLYRVLSQALAEGRFGPGGPLPSEPRLMRDYDVSRSTVRRALARLETEGRIERKRGSGTYAREGGEKVTGSRDLSPVLDDRGGAPAGASSRTFAFEHIPTPGFLLGEWPSFGESVLLIRRIRYVERQPIVLETAWLPGGIGGGMTRPQLDAGGAAILTVLGSLGYRSASLEREFAALEADPLAANSLGIAVGAPLFNVRTLAHGMQHPILAYINCLYRADRYEAHAAIDIRDPARHRKGMRT